MHRSTRMSISHQTATELKGAVNVEGIGFNVDYADDVLSISGGNKDNCCYNIGPLLGLNLPLPDAVQAMVGLHAADNAADYIVPPAPEVADAGPETVTENPPVPEPSSGEPQQEELGPQEKTPQQEEASAGPEAVSPNDPTAGIGQDADATDPLAQETDGKLPLEPNV